ncbi:MAG: efflux RND transporter periplasmic adaptor subunit [Deltaproteobacteria bacterium]|nr:efflux RND transporter periplasmic adaptor subunit [Candidatus Anaeroferrophillus wilburensis]MBN2888759.1 efflux RND transporter periplasmic adaptor subunit [Deltaproteobacteria bacterium]
MCGAVFLLYAGSLAAAEKQPPGRPPAKVVVAPVREQQIARTMVITGTVEADLDSLVASELDGVVAELLVTEGQRVKKGDCLCRLNGDLLERQLQVETREIEHLTVLHEKAKTDFSRIEQLFEQEAAARQLFDDRFYEVRRTEALIAVGRARVRHLTAELAKKAIYAPFAGLVVEKLVEVGEWVGAGQAICRLIDDRQLVVTIPVPAASVAYVREQSSFLVYLREGGKPLAGTTNRLVPVADRQARSLPFLINLPAGDGVFAGMEAMVEIPAAPPARWLTVPRDALVTGGEQMRVFVIADAMAQPIPVQVEGYAGEDALVVADGLQPGMVVAVRGNERLRPSQPVEIIQ